MTTAVTPARTNPLVILGTILVLIGLVAGLGRLAGIDLATLIGDQTWPLLVIVPGLALLGLAFVASPPDGTGFAIAGAIVTAVGTILLVQANTGLWESWAYVWALIPGSAGLALAVYGWATGARDEVRVGLRLMLIAGILFVVGAWYFSAIFATGLPPVDIATWWPVALIAVGAFIAIRALLPERRRDEIERPAG
jgi:hypothetical protein